MTVAERKKQLIDDDMKNNVTAAKGRRISLICVLTVISARLLFMLYELIYFSISGTSINVLSELLVLPLILILYMVYDGNRGLSSVSLISAAVRIIYHFSAVYSGLPEGDGKNAYTALLLIIMAVQIIISLILMTSRICGEYFAVRLKINIKIRGEMINK